MRRRLDARVGDVQHGIAASTSARISICCSSCCISTITLRMNAGIIGTSVADGVQLTCPDLRTRLAQAGQAPDFVLAIAICRIDVGSMQVVCVARRVLVACWLSFNPIQNTLVA